MMKNILENWLINNSSVRESHKIQNTVSFCTLQLRAGCSLAGGWIPTFAGMTREVQEWRNVFCNTFLRWMLFVLLLMSTLFSGRLMAETLTVYSSRSEHLIKPFFDQFTQQTGIDIKLLNDKAGSLINRLVAEGEDSPADLLMTVDAGNLWYATEQNLLRSIDSTFLENQVPQQFRDPQNRWFALTLRARTIIFNRSKVKPSELSSYQQLADVVWKNRLCLRTSKKVYNQSLVAMMIDNLGTAKTKSVVEGWVNNLAMPPLGSDTQVIKAVARGACDVGIVNNYYVGREINKNPQLADTIGMFFADQENLGTHVNVSGIGVTRTSKYPQKALELIEWLASDDTQKSFASINHEYPIRSGIDSHQVSGQSSQFKYNPTAVAIYGKLQSEAIKLMDQAGYR